MIVAKAVKMAEIMNIPIIGLVENMSYFRCPDNGKDYQIFGDSHIDEIALNITWKYWPNCRLNRKSLPHVTRGRIEFLDGDWLDPVAILEEKNGES